MHLAVITNGHKSCKYLRCANIHADAVAVRRHHEPPPRNWGWALRGREVSTARPRPALEQPRTAIIGMSGRVLLILTYFISYCIEGRDSSIKHMNIYLWEIFCHQPHQSEHISFDIDVTIEELLCLDIMPHAGLLRDPVYSGVWSCSGILLLHVGWISGFWTLGHIFIWSNETSK